MVYNVKEWGVNSDEQTLITEKIQRIVDECSKNGGGRVYFPKGTYVLSSVFLRDNVTIELAEGALILGSEKFADYAPHEKLDYPLYQDASHSYFHTSMFVGENCENVGVIGKGKIDMRSVWDEENVRNMVHRGAKCIALRDCKNVSVKDIDVQNVTDLAIYFAGCENVEVSGVKMRVYIDGISPDNSKNVRISDCEIECGDDGLVFKSSYTLNRLDVCENITVKNCKIKSRCNAIKFGTETNGGFKNIDISDCEVRETRLAGIAIESVDGAVIDGITIKNIQMYNVCTPIFVYLNKRMRGPKELEVGSISNVTLENVTAVGPYVPFECIEWNYAGYVAKDRIEKPWWAMSNSETGEDCKEDIHITSSVSGLDEKPIENITLRNIHLELVGGCQTPPEKVTGPNSTYPEVWVYGLHLPAKGIYFRNVNGLTVENVTVKTERGDIRPDFVFEEVTDLKLL